MLTFGDGSALDVLLLPFSPFDGVRRAVCCWDRADPKFEADVAFLFWTDGLLDDDDDDDGVSPAESFFEEPSISSFPEDFLFVCPDDLLPCFITNLYPRFIIVSEIFRGSVSAYFTITIKVTSERVESNQIRLIGDCYYVPSVLEIAGVVSAKLIACATADKGEVNARRWLALRIEAAWRPGAELISHRFLVNTGN